MPTILIICPLYSKYYKIIVLMLPLVPRQGDKVELFTPLMSYITLEAGPEVAIRLKSTISLRQELRNSLIQLYWFLNDEKTMLRMCSEAKLYLSMWTSISQVVTFGEPPNNLNIQLAWRDSYTKKKITKFNPLIERLSILYNLAGVYNKLGVNRAAKEGKYKEEIESFMTDNWMFEHV